MCLIDTSRVDLPANLQICQPDGDSVSRTTLQKRTMVDCVYWHRSIYLESGEIVR